jgi:uncharacterized membrane protein YkoI
MRNANGTVWVALGAGALVFGLLGAGYAASGGQTQYPAYTSSIQVKDQDREEQGERHEERGEAAQLASLAKIDATQATSAALAQVPGAVLKVALDNENGNLVYSVEIKTASNEIKDVKVDAGNGQVLHMDAEPQGEGEGEDE